MKKPLVVLALSLGLLTSVSFAGASADQNIGDVIKPYGAEIVSKEFGHKIVAQCAQPTVTRCEEFKLFLTDNNNKLMQPLTKDKTLAFGDFKNIVKARSKANINFFIRENQETLMTDLMTDTPMNQLRDSQMKPLAKQALLIPTALIAEPIALIGMLEAQIIVLGAEGGFAIAKTADRIFVTAKVKSALQALVKDSNKSIKLSGERFALLAKALE